MSDAAPPAPRPNFLVRAIATVSIACGVIAAVMIFTAVLITCELIWVRFVLNKSTIWQTEAVTYLMIAATMLGLPYVQHLKGHVNVDLVPMLLPPPIRRVLMLVTLTATGVVVAVMIYYGYDLFHMAYTRNWRSETVWGAPLWIPYLSLPIGFGLYFVQLAADAFGLLNAPPPATHADELTIGD
ncbi:TRAP transporter small permease [Acuticoccus sp. M5D2P5]|uniref:TRAP transporter small permease n=1 Tax=Acuticoccus kalidii TaxID=2910977 RepID=UPI001F36DCCA|nr:TRAP transporter small permease [Acuticoccus kalidii]MCF3932088.1 TRAP transporter small permease [Acuticoccus kalidii]